MRIIAFIVFILLGTYSAVGQDIDARSPVTKTKSTGKQREAEKKKAKQQSEFEKAIKEGRKQHYKHQDKSTRKRMKKGKRKSSQWQKNEREFFLKRWFRKK